MNPTSSSVAPQDLAIRLQRLREALASQQVEADLTDCGSPAFGSEEAVVESQFSNFDQSFWSNGGMA